MVKYKISIERWDGDEVDTIMTAPVTAEQVAEFAPELLALTLGVEVEAADPGQPASATTAAAPKRKRRTKAEIAADAAKAAAGNGAAAQPDPPADPDDKVYSEQATASAPVPANETPAFEPPAGVAVPPTPTQAAAAPSGYNPFVKQQ